MNKQKLVAQGYRAAIQHPQRVNRMRFTILQDLGYEGLVAFNRGYYRGMK